MQLLAAGHRVVDADLSTAYGEGVVAGATVQLLGRGCTAVVAFQSHLSGAVRDRVAATLLAELDRIDAPVQELEERGWSRSRTGRWELLLMQR